MNDIIVDFDRLENRRHSDSLKWSVGEDELPMWVADMDFRTAPAIIEALHKKVEEGIFGYAVIPNRWYEAIQGWWKTRHHFDINKEWLVFSTGVVPAISSIVKRITNIGDQVIVQTPVYDIFFHSIENSGRHVIENKLSYDKQEYSIDFDALEKQLAQPLTTMMILCNPHNPIGKIWSEAELCKIGQLCKKHHVVVLSDEIHCDLTEPGCSYFPFASVAAFCAEISITCISASKAFNIAGVQSAAVIIPNQALRQKVVRGLNSDEIAEPNSFAAEAVIAAFTKGEPWLEALKNYISENKKIVEAYLAQKVPELKVLPATATYLLWIDCARITEDTEELCQFIRKQNGLFLTAGKQYRGNGASFIRMNVACSKMQVRKALLKLQSGIEEYKKRVYMRC